MISTTTTNQHSPLTWSLISKRELTSRLQASTTNEEAINIRLLGEITAVLLTDRATVDDAGVVSSLGGDGRAEPLADRGVDFLRLFGGSHLAGADGPGFISGALDTGWVGMDVPDGFVGNHHLGPLLFGELGGRGVELAGDDLDSLVGFAFLLGLVSPLA